MSLPGKVLEKEVEFMQDKTFHFLCISTSLRFNGLCFAAKVVNIKVVVLFSGSIEIEPELGF